MLMNHKLLKILFLAIMFALNISGCSNNSSNSNNDTGNTKTSAGIAIPSVIKATALPNAGTLAAEIFVDGKAGPKKTVDVSATEVTFTLTVSAGSHNFTLVFYYDDPVFNSQTWELARATSSTVNVTGGSTTKVTFPAYSYQDYDGDGVSNLLELDSSTRTDPGIGTCILDSAKLSCQLG
jgi:hypothetical protein